MYRWIILALSLIYLTMALLLPPLRQNPLTGALHRVYPGICWHRNAPLHECMVAQDCWSADLRAQHIDQNGFLLARLRNLRTLVQEGTCQGKAR